MVTYHSSNPLITECDNWLSEQDIEEILSKDYNWKDAKVRVDGELIFNDTRKCKIHRIEYGNNEYFDSLLKRVADFFNVENFMQIEPLLLIRYDVGDYVDFHTDLTSGFKSQRISTMIMYLNDDFEGGHTTFHESNISIKPKRGSCLVIKYNAQKPMFHRGDSIISGSKYILTAFVRDSEFTLVDRKLVSY